MACKVHIGHQRLRLWLGRVTSDERGIWDDVMSPAGFLVTEHYPLFWYIDLRGIENSGLSPYTTFTHLGHVPVRKEAPSATSASTT